MEGEKVCSGDSLPLAAGPLQGAVVTLCRRSLAGQSHSPHTWEANKDKDRSWSPRVLFEVLLLITQFLPPGFTPQRCQPLPVVPRCEHVLKSWAIVGHSRAKLHLHIVHGLVSSSGEPFFLFFSTAKALRDSTGNTYEAWPKHTVTV